MTPTGTSLLGLVKHVATVEIGYLGACVGRPWPEPIPWANDEGYEAGPTCTPSRRAARDDPRPLPPLVGPRGRVGPHPGAGRTSLRALVAGGAPGRRRSATCWCTCSPRPPTTPATPTSCARRIDGRAGEDHDDLGGRGVLERLRGARPGRGRRPPRRLTLHTQPRHTPTGQFSWLNAGGVPGRCSAVARKCPLGVTRSSPWRARRPCATARTPPRCAPCRVGLVRAELAVELPGLAQLVGRLPHPGAEPGHEGGAERGGLDDLRPLDGYAEQVGLELAQQVVRAAPPSTVSEVSLAASCRRRRAPRTRSPPASRAPGARASYPA